MIKEVIAFIDDNEGGTSGFTNEELIRCGRCKYFREEYIPDAGFYQYCEHLNMEVNNNWYCGDAINLRSED